MIRHLLSLSGDTYTDIFRLFHFRFLLHYGIILLGIIYPIGRSGGRYDELAWLIQQITLC